MEDKAPHESTGPLPGAWEQTGPEGARSLEQIDLDIAETSAHIDAATYRLLADIAEFDRREGWALAGARSCAEWLSFRIGLSPGTARDHVRVARKLEDHPLISAAFARGLLSYSKVRATFRVATAENEEEILATARSCTAAQLEKLVRACRKVGRADLDTAQRQREQRYLRLSYAEDGSLIIEGRLPPEVGAIVERALVSAETSAAEAPETNPAQRRADALGVLAESALENLGVKERGEPYQVVVHVDADLLANPESEGQCRVDNGPALSAETARRIACDAAVVALVEDETGSVLSVGRKSRRVSMALWRALKARDFTCAFPGCERSGGLTVHHVTHWADGGETSPGNCTLLCRRCHWLVHEGGFTVKHQAPDDLVFYSPAGQRLPDRWEPPELPADPMAVLKAEHAALGHDIDGETGHVVGWGEAIDLDMAMEGLLPREPRQVWTSAP